VRFEAAERLEQLGLADKGGMCRPADDIDQKRLELGRTCSCSTNGSPDLNPTKLALGISQRGYILENGGIAGCGRAEDWPATGGSSKAIWGARHVPGAIGGHESATGTGRLRFRTRPS
jgi:hypothetical protein